MKNNSLQTISGKLFLSCENLTHLDISGNFLHVLHINTLRSLRNLYILNLTNNKLTDMPIELFSSTKKLKHLYLDHNELKTLSHHLFDKLPNLQYFYVSHNNIEKLDEDFNISKSVKYISMAHNKIVQLPQKIFSKLQRLISVLLDGNKIRNITGLFDGRYNLVQITLSNNDLQEIEEKLAYPLNNLYELDLSHNNIHKLPGSLFNMSRRLKSLSFSSNKISYINESTFQGLNEIHWLYLSRNNITWLPEKLFWPFNLTGTLDLSSNKLTGLPLDLFRKQNKAHHLEVLLLQRNKLRWIPEVVFRGLPKLKIICLFYNDIQFLADNAFSGAGIEYIYLFGNHLSELTNRSFVGKNISQIHLYKNNLSRIEDNAISQRMGNTTLFLNCDKINQIDQNFTANIKCVTPTYVPDIIVDFNVVNYFRAEGFHCKYIDHLRFRCFTCHRGTYGNGKDGCIPCPRGGFYQDDIGVIPSNSGELACKKCTDGTFSDNESATSAEDCKVCPEGTTKSAHAGFRACPCKIGYARKDRFGHCEQCTEEGVNCTGQDFRTIKPGYFWSWDFDGTDLPNYINFVTNLRMYNNDYNKSHNTYNGTIPRAHKCPRQDNCQNIFDNIKGSCAKGYKGWLCTKCESNYYSVMNNCFLCPSLWVLFAEIIVIVIACLCIYLIVLWRYKTQKRRNEGERSTLDILTARGKIVLGFYQVVGEFFKSLNEVNWVGKLYVIGEFISYVELNILKIFVRPQCVKENLIINPKIEFIFGISFPFTCMLLAAVVYKIKIVIFEYRYGRLLTMQYQQKLTSKLMTITVVVLFVTYPPICTTVFQLYPGACQKFCLDIKKTHCIRKLRSDYDINCDELTYYHYATYVATVCYVIAFPSILLYLLKKQKLHEKSSRRRVRRSCCGEEDEFEPLVQNNDIYEGRPAWGTFLCESYKPEYWYWEIIELTRKVSQTVTITLLGWEHKLTVLLTIGISVLFLTLHARFMPMKSTFEQRLQVMFSLTAILINVLVAGMRFSEEYDDLISDALILLNVVVIIIIAAEVFFRLVNNFRKTGIYKVICNFIARTKRGFVIHMKTW
ncbi:Insulin-like growth factor-binding protein complex acid labile subunit [Holothuria leucospilota]|uniref:Insulin-like growth factor-binding protein complex acid labile subunit n=1 Tax=Holothuria leucospilota TaxID=206669 RepID=A0A9Q1CS50_HOLLE|nr:Insulin-like growth factor-binding protein complex acid labile subunit [Holothuria leucospilota]